MNEKCVYCGGDVRSNSEYFAHKHYCKKVNDKPFMGGMMKPDTTKGLKTDKGKPRWSLFPMGTLIEVVKVLEFGAKRYEVDNWQHVTDPERRYYDATMRHLEAWWNGEVNDPDSGLPHLAHAVCSILFIMWFDKEKRDA